jgi:4-hydroxybenzoate polyprenyltransferase
MRAIASVRARARGFPDARRGVHNLHTHKGLKRKGNIMVILLLLLLVLILAGAGFAIHALWIAAVVFALFWIIGVALGRGESAGSRRFYRW